MKFRKYPELRTLFSKLLALSSIFTFYVLSSIFYVLCSIFYIPTAQALTGVGSAVTQVSSGPQITVSGRHAPNAEIVVVHEPTGKVVASGLDSGTGIFTLTFRASTAQANDLVIFAVDPANQNKEIVVPSSGLTDRLLPPSIVYDENNSDNRDTVAVAGYTFPGSQVNVVITDEEDNLIEANVLAESDGGWGTIFSDLDPGTYEVTASSRLGLRESSSSLLLEVIIDPPPAIVQALPKPVSDTVENVSKAVENVADRVIPAPVKETVKQVAPQAEQVAETVTPVASAGLLTQLLLVGRDLLYFVIQGGIALMQYFGFWKKRFPWGVVYDAFTKQPVNLATVRLFMAPAGENQRKRLVETDVSSKSGIFSFEADPGNYLIEVRKPGYTFPSVIVKGQVDGEYSNVYRGEVFKLNRQAVVSVSVPIDPDEVAKLSLKFKITRFLRERMYLFTITMLIAGLLMSLIAVIGGQAGINGFLVVFYSGVLAAQWYIYQRRQKSWGKVKDAKGNPVPGIQLNLIDPQFNKLVQRRVTDEEGKYQFVVPAGRYLIKVENVEYDLLTNNPKVYQGQEIQVQGDKPKLLTLPIKVKPSNS